LALWSLVLLASGAASGTAHANDTPISVALSTNRGCGSGAVFQVGDATSFDFAVGQEAMVTLRLQRPDGVLDLLANYSARPGYIYRVSGAVGNPTGQRTLMLYASADHASGQAACTYSVTGQQSDTDIGVTLTTDRGCGDNAVYHSGEAVNITYSTDRNALVLLKVEGPNGTRTIKENVAANAGQSYPITLTAGAVGNYKLVMDAGADGRSGHIECAFKVDSPPQLNATLTTDRGCGTDTVYHTGEAVNISFSTDESAFVVLKLVGPNGPETLKDNFVTTAGVLHPVTVTAGVVGNYTLVMDAAVEDRSVHVECTFRVDVASIGVTLTTDRGCGDDVVFHSGEPVNINYSVDRNSFVLLKLVGPNGTQTLKDNVAANAGQSYPVSLTAGRLGNYQLVLDAGADGRTSHIECNFRVEQATQIGVTLTTNQGCGSNAVFRSGDSVNITYSTDRNAFVLLKLVGPNGTQTLKENVVANAGQSYPVTVTAGAVGNYTLVMDAGADGLSGHIECAFSVGQATQIGVALTTNQGCGSNAVFRSGDSVNITYSTDRNAFVLLKLVGPNGTQTLKDNVAANAGQSYAVSLTAGAVGNYTLVMDAGADRLSGHIECAFRVEQATQIGVTLTTNQGCGSDAVFRSGDPVNFTFSTDRTAFVVLKLMGPNGTQTLRENIVANAGQTYPGTVTAGAVGNYTLVMDAGADGKSAHIECTFRVDAAVAQIGVDVATNKGCGADAVFQPFEAMYFDFRVSQSSLVRFQVEMIGGGTQVLLDNFVAQPGYIYRLHTAFAVQGNFRVRVRAAADSASGEDTCEFAVRN
jgi:hypothetical protein